MSNKREKRGKRNKVLSGVRIRIQNLIDQGFPHNEYCGNYDCYNDRMAVFHWANLFDTNKETMQWCFTQLSKEGIVYHARIWDNCRVDYQIRRK